jgi:hypothetical protein
MEIQNIIDRLQKQVENQSLDFSMLSKHLSNKNYIAAIGEVKRLLEIRPDDLSLLFNYGYCLIETGFAEKAKNIFLSIMKNVESHPYLKVQAISNYWLCCDYLGVPIEGRESIQKYYDKPADIPKIFSQDKIKIAFISEDLFNHPVGNAFSRILKNINPNKFEIFVYHTSDKEDEVTKEIQKSCHHFIFAHGPYGVYPLQSDDIYRQLRDSQVNVLCDLGGHTNGGKRLNLFCRRPCPIQITMLGYPFDTGLDCFDAFIPGMPYFQTQKPDDSITIGCLASPVKISKNDILFYDEILTERKDVELIYARLGNQYTQEKIDEIINSHSDENQSRISILNLNIPYKMLLEMFDAIVDTENWPAHALLQDALSMGIPIIYNEQSTKPNHGNDIHVKTNLDHIKYQDIKKRRILNRHSRYVSDTMQKYYDSIRWTKDFIGIVNKLYGEGIKQNAGN